MVASRDSGAGTMASDKEKDPGLKSFKISDQVKQPVDKPRPWARATPKAGAPGAPADGAAGGSAGFPRIEALVEQDAPDLSGFDKRAAELDEMVKAAKSPKEKAAATKAAAAYAKARALISYLLE